MEYGHVELIVNLSFLLLLLVKLSLVLGRCLLVLLVLGDEVVHVGLSLSELHLIHTLAWKIVH